ncbi:Mov34/MPN/PAD-1 family protein [Thiothrix nivea]|uniref:JAB domain-containing protein n=1 Tax=Thiothrix nivea (strain ATCC 35100 / DSM 5205 / JP2) TaxID=870187 RepID=A0A656HIC6_THINJ|nr:Mov34/MPN/PAD-1 family protein [Thiothrix nivea]EIJ34969.1 hypothetical protein Thini_2417 [Thiothrix nivea DSM 5205]
MALKLSFGKDRPQVFAGIFGVINELQQTIMLEPKMLAHVYKYRQVLPLMREAGGQLFGIIENNIVRVVCATGPYKGDIRSRYCYRSNPIQAQKEINQQSQSGLLYLGEWHTHAENNPTASNIDIATMQKLIMSSTLNTNLVLMLIVGKVIGCQGLDLLCVSKVSTYRALLMNNKEGSV